MNIIERLYQIFDYKGDSVYKISKKIDVSNGYFSKTRAKQGNVGSDIIEKIVNYYTDVNVEWLITGNGEMLKTKSEENSIKKNDGKNDGIFDEKPNVKKTPSNEISLQKEVQDLKDRLREQKDSIMRVERDKDAIISLLNGQIENLKEQRDKWEQMYNLAQSEIKELKNVQEPRDTKTLVG